MRIHPLPPSTLDPSSGATGSERGPAFVTNAAGVVFPDADLTPGNAVPGVSAGTFCTRQYVADFRRPHFSTMASAFAGYGVSTHERDRYQVDHLIPVSLGGSNDTENLWPQPYAEPMGATQKDQLERQLTTMVCSGALGVLEARAAITTDWAAAFDRYVASTVPG